METSAPREGLRRCGRLLKGLSRPTHAIGRIDIVRRRRLVPLLAVSLTATPAPALATSTANAAPLVASSYAARPPAALPSAAQAGALDRYTKQKPQWKRCASTAPAEFQCAPIKVPLDYRAPGGKRIDLAISRIRTAEPGKRHAPAHHHPQHRPRPGPAPGGPRRGEDLVPRILVRHLPGRRLHPALPGPRRPVRAGQRGRPGARLAGHGPVVGVGRRARVRPVDRMGRRAPGRTPSRTRGATRSPESFRRRT